MIPKTIWTPMIGYQPFAWQNIQRCNIMVNEGGMKTMGD